MFFIFRYKQFREMEKMLIIRVGIFLFSRFVCVYLRKLHFNCIHPI